MRKLEYQVRFVTPAFLGDAEQNGRWRTPPFKALLRQWWRVAEVRGRKPDVEALHKRDGELFGRAADEGTTASRVRLRFDWRGGTAKSDRWPKFPTVTHPEVTHKAGVDLYLAYGPVDVGSKLKRNSYVPATDRPQQARPFTIGVPDSEEKRFRDVVTLAHAFGALGSRSRNGWGSLHFDDHAKDRALSAEEIAAMLDPSGGAGRDWVRPFSRNWRLALDTDWCHAIGKDEAGLLLWRTEAMKKWEDVLKTLAEVKIAFRTQLHFKGGGTHAKLCDRQLLAYPVTNHTLGSWGKEARSANQIIFKVIPSGASFLGFVAHLPHGLPGPLVEGLSSDDRAGLDARQQHVWAAVHAKLDNNLTRLP